MAVNDYQCHSCQLVFFTLAVAVHAGVGHCHCGLPQNGNDAICALLESKGACFTAKDTEGFALLREAVQVAAGGWHACGLLPVPFVGLQCVCVV